MNDWIVYAGKVAFVLESREFGLRLVCYRQNNPTPQGFVVFGGRMSERSQASLREVFASAQFVDRGRSLNSFKSRMTLSDDDFIKMQLMSEWVD